MCLGGICVDKILCVNDTVLVGGDGFLDVRYASFDNFRETIRTYTADRFSDDPEEPRFCQSHEICCSYNSDSDANEDYLLEETTIYKCGYRQNHQNNIISKSAAESLAEYGKIFTYNILHLTYFTHLEFKSN